ncbi:hypothetical protein [Microbacterium karelineae]|uniref:hypothetical protein n=1 Tax=Microbacterium karelineae TaxID=2654283 RepID=UPI0012EA0F1F|nr:hypothetical protein [Microbacterium karelineae]
MTSREQLPDAALVAFASVGYLALLVAGLGVASLATDSDVISTRGVGIVPAYVAAGAAIAAFALLVRGAIAAERPSYFAALGTAIGSAAAHLVVIAFGALFETGDLGIVLGVTREVLIGWVAPVVAGAALVAAWAAIAVRRTGAERPRWPWERRP